MTFIFYAETFALIFHQDTEIKRGSRGITPDMLTFRNQMRVRS